MRPFTFLLTLALFYGLAISAAVMPLADNTLVAPKRFISSAPKLERPPPGHLNRKRDAGKMFTFGGYHSSNLKEGEFKKLEEPVEDNGHPHPWCQGFEGSNGYTPGQKPVIEVAHMDTVQRREGEPQVPQHICWFYNDFDCDPSKGKVEGLTVKGATVSFLTDLDKKNKSDDSEANRNFFFDHKDTNGKRYQWIKAYGCMLWEDSSFYDDDSSKGSNGADGSLGEMGASEALASLIKRAIARTGF